MAEEPHTHPTDSQKPKNLESKTVVPYKGAKPVEEINPYSIPVFLADMAQKFPEQKAAAARIEQVLKKTESLKAMGVLIEHRLCMGGAELVTFFNTGRLPLYGDALGTIVNNIEEVMKMYVRPNETAFHPPMKVQLNWTHGSIDTKPDVDFSLHIGAEKKDIHGEMARYAMKRANRESAELKKENTELAKRLAPIAQAGALANAEIGTSHGYVSQETMGALAHLETEKFNGKEQILETTSAYGYGSEKIYKIKGVPTLTGRVSLFLDSSDTHSFTLQDGFLSKAHWMMEQSIQEARLDAFDSDPTLTMVYQFAMNLRRIEHTFGQVPLLPITYGNDKSHTLADYHAAFKKITTHTTGHYLRAMETVFYGEPKTPLPAPTPTPEENLPAEKPVIVATEQAAPQPQVPVENPIPGMVQKLSAWGSAMRAYMPTISMRKTTKKPDVSSAKIETPVTATLEKDLAVSPLAEEKKEETAIPVIPPVAETVPEVTFAPDEPVIEKKSAELPRVVPAGTPSLAAAIEPRQTLPTKEQGYQGKQVVRRLSEASRPSVATLRTKARDQAVNVSLEDGGSKLMYHAADQKTQQERVAKYRDGKQTQNINAIFPVEMWDRIRLQKEENSEHIRELTETMKELNQTYGVEIALTYLTDLKTIERKLESGEELKKGLELKVHGNVEELKETMKTIGKALKRYEPDNPFNGQTFDILWFDTYHSNVQGSASREKIMLQNGVTEDTIHHELGHICDFKEGNNWERVWYDKSYDRAISFKRYLNAKMEQEMGPIQKNYGSSYDEEMKEKRSTWLKSLDSQDITSFSYRFAGEQKKVNIREYMNENGSFIGTTSEYGLTNGAEERAELWMTFVESGPTMHGDRIAQQKVQEMGSILAEKQILSKSWFSGNGMDVD